MYLSKYRHVNCSPNLVPVTKNPGSRSPPISSLLIVTFADQILNVSSFCPFKYN